MSCMERARTSTNEAVSIETPKCEDCKKRFTESCPMHYSVRLGSYNTSIMTVDNTLDTGYCDRFKAFSREKEEEEWRMS